MSILHKRNSLLMTGAVAMALTAGSLLAWWMVARAYSTGKTASGLDLGPLGTLTLRVVQPVLEKGTLAGYVELGKEIEDILQTIHARAGNQMAVVIRKKYLNRQIWEEGMRMLGRDADWNRLADDAVIYTSEGHLPAAFTALAGEASSNRTHTLTNREIIYDGKTCRVSKTPLKDASGKEIGDLLIIFDISANKAAFMRILYLGGTSAAVLLTLLLCFVYVLLHRTDMRVRAQHDKLKDSEERIRAIMNSAHDAIMMIDHDGNVSYWNRAAENMFGHTHEEAIGRNLHALIVPERFLPAHHAAFPIFQQTGHGAAIGKTLELCARRKDGSEIDVALSLSAVQIGEKWHAIGIAQDITDRKRAEAELLATNLSLEKATALAKDMATQAEAASIAKSEFLANMSHEIRTPMNGIIGMTGLLMDTGLSNEQQRYANIVRTSGESLLGLINDILDFSKIEAHKLDLETVDFDLSALLDDFAAAMAIRAHEKGLELLCAADPSVPTLVRGDFGRLRQILTNLTGNAIKFTKSGEVAVRVTVEETSPSILLRFSIRDTGIGIPADKLGLLFKQFSQIDSSTTRNYGGTGLGLAISRQLAELMGGTTGVSSVEGKGSEFWFTVRLDVQAGEAQAKSLPPANLSGIRILIVDDNATSREILTTRLTSWGMRPSEAQDAAAALHAFQSALSEHDPFPIAIIDMQMPGMDGETLGRIIKADKSLADTRMVMLTSLGMRGDAKRFEAIGFAAYATKPIQHQDLKAVLSLALTQQNKKTDSVPPPIAAPHKVSELLNMFAGSKARILLAEDNITNQTVALAILAKLGLHADAVADGAEAVKALETIPYDLVLMDVQMPHMNGFEATKLIRQRESARAEGGRLKPETGGSTDADSVSFSDSETQVSGFPPEADPPLADIPHPSPHLPIIAMTANAMQGDREMCIKAGMDDYVSKPVTPQALADALKKWLRKSEDATIVEKVQ
ncbi:MAG: response regulator [bacterium]